MSCYYNYIYRPLPLFKIRYSPRIILFTYILTFQKYRHTYEFPHTYGSIFFCMPAFLSGKLFYSCRLLGLMQTIHASAVRCCFCRIKCHFSQNCCCNIFLFAACHITHLHFILIASISHFADFSSSMLKFRHNM